MKFNNLLVAGISFLFSLGGYAQCPVSVTASTVDVLCGDTVRLNAIGAGISVFENDFNGCNIGAGWAATSQARFDNPCGISPNGSCYVWFGNTSPAPRNATTNGYNLSTGGTICFTMRYATQAGASPCEGIDLPDEGVYLEYSVAGGPWKQIAYYPPNGGNDPYRTSWNRYCEAIPDSARFPNTRIRWIQKASSNLNADHWGLENVKIEVNPPGATYTWQHTGIAKPTGDTPDVVPTQTTTYTCDFRYGNCTSSGNITVVVRKQSITASKNPIGPVCPGDNTQLDVTSTFVPPAISCGISTTGCLGNTRTVDIGNGTVNNANYSLLGKMPITSGNVTLNGCTSTPGPDPNEQVYSANSYDASATTQMIFLASEFPGYFTSAGGQISKLQFNVIASSGTYKNFSISIGCTAKQSFASTAEAEFVTGLAQVFGPKDFTFAAGWNTIELDRIYDWNGTSNLVVQVCWFGDGQKAGDVLKTASGFNSVIHTHLCDEGSCMNYHSQYTVTDQNRPTVKFDICYRPKPDLTYVWTPNTALTDDSIKNPIANPNQTTTYTITVRDMNTPAGCAVSQNITVNVDDIGTLQASFDPVCQNGILNLKSTMATPVAGVVYNWSGPGGFTANTQNATRNPAVAGQYIVTASKGTCIARDTIIVTVDVPPNTGTPGNKNICTDGGTLNLFTVIGGNPDRGGTWKAIGSLNGGSLADSIFNPAQVNPGSTFTFEYAKTVGGCPEGKTQITVKVDKRPNAGKNGDSTVCESLGNINLISVLDGSPQTGGTWKNLATGNSVTSPFSVSGGGGNTYNFEYRVAGTGACPDSAAVARVVVINQPEAGNNGNAEVCFNGSINLFNLLGSPDPGGTWRKNGLFGGTLNTATGDFDANGADPGTVSFVYTLTGTTPCKSDSAIVTLKINSYPQISNPSTLCLSGNTAYSVSFEVTGGDAASYTVTPAGTFSGSTFTSNAIPNGQQSTFIVSDAKGCSKDTLVINRDCNCETAAGTMGSELVELCEGELTPDTYQGGFVDDGDDILLFYLHDGNGTSLVNVHDKKAQPVFGFNPSTMSFEQVYYISAVASDDSSGNNRMLDVCLSVAPGTPVVWHRSPNASISGSINICPGEDTDLLFTFSAGEAPFSVILDDGAVSDSIANLSSASNTHTVSPIDTTTYNLIRVYDNNGCSRSLNGPPAVVKVNSAAIGTIQDLTVCSDGSQNPASFFIDVEGAGSAFTAVYSNDLNANKVTISNIAEPGAIVTPAEFDPDGTITFKLDTIYDNSGSVCPGVTLGSFTAYPAPTAILSGNATYCQGQTINLQLNLTGIGPWDVVYTDGTTNYTYNATIRNPVINPADPGPGTHTYSLVSVTDQVPGGPGCTGAVSGTAIVTVNSPANVTLLIEDQNNNRKSSDEYCFGDGPRNLVFIVDPNSGSGNAFDVTYTAEGGSPVTVQVKRPEHKIQVDPFIGSHNYNITLVRDTTPAGCTGTGTNATIKVNPIPTVGFLSQPQQICMGSSATITFTVTGNGTVSFGLQGSGADTRLYSASSVAGQVSITVTPTSPGTATYTIVNVTDGSSPTCTGASGGSINITVNPAPTARFTTPNYEMCEGTTLLLAYSLTGNGQITATFTDGVNPPVTVQRTAGSYTEPITNLAGGNTYTFQFTAVTDGSVPSCPGTFSQTSQVVVRDIPSVSLSLSQSTVCQGDPVTLTFNCYGNPDFTVEYDDDKGGTYTTEMGITSSRTVTVPSDISRSFKVTRITDGSNPVCTATPNVPVILTVNPLPAGSISGISEICSGSTATVDINLQGAQPFNVTFSNQNPPNNSYSATGLKQGTNPYSFSPAPTDSLELSNLVITDANNCTNNGSGPALVNVNPIPAPQFTLDPPGGCSPLPVTFTHQPEGTYNISSMVWNFGDGSPVVNDASTYVQTHTYIDRATYQVNLTVTSAQNCTGSVVETVTVYPDPVADFTWEPNKVTIDDAYVRFYNKSIGGQNFTWQIGDMDVLTQYEPLYQFPAVEETVYPICLVANSGFGCVDTICKDLKVEGMVLVNIPNTFTPNGDGINEIWKPVYEGVRPDIYSLVIFDRWGEVIFETDDIDKGWDGTNKQNEPCQQGIYAYRITGKSKFSAEKVEKVGNIMLSL